MELQESKKINRIFLLFLLAVAVFFSSCGSKEGEVSDERLNYLNRSLVASLVLDKLSSDDKSKIDQWIIEKGINPYGDSKYTFYAGGTPLYNEATGIEIDRYEYILIKHMNIVKELDLSIQDIVDKLWKQIEEGSLVPDVALANQEKKKKKNNN